MKDRKMVGLQAGTMTWVRYYHLVLLVLVFGVLLLAGPVAAQADPDDVTTGADVVLVGPAVTSYASDYSVSFEVAEQNLRRIVELQEIMVSIIGLERSRVAGTGIDHGVDMRGWVWLVGDDPASASAARIADAYGDIEIRFGAAHTYAELRKAQDSLDFDSVAGPETKARLSDVVVYTAVDVDANSVEIGIDPARAHTRARRSISPVPVSDEELATEADWVVSMFKGYVDVPIVIGDGRGYGPTASFLGGEEMGLCTSGFAAKQNGGPYGIITAGHCEEKIVMNGIELPNVVGWESRTADAQFHVIPLPANPGDDYHNLSNTFRTRRHQCHNVYTICEVRSDISRFSMQDYDQNIQVTRGDYVCHTGHRSGVSCGTITNIHLVPRFPEEDDPACREEDNGAGVVCAAVFVRVTGPSLRECRGDSGGPWYSGLGVAYGIHMGGNGRRDCTNPGKRAIFSAVREVESFLGVQVLTAPPSPPGAPGEVSATIDPNDVRVGWSAPSSGAAGYIISRKIHLWDQPYREIARTSMEIEYSPDTYFYDRLSGLVPGMRYTYRVKAIDNLGNTGSWSYSDTITAPTLTAIPGPPTNVRVTKGPRYVRVGWSPPSTGATKYQIHRRIARDGYQYTRIATTSEIYFYELVAGLNPGTEYYYRVEAVNSVGDTGPWSNYGAITIPTQETTITAVPASPGNVSVTQGPRYVRVGWSAPSTGAMRYHIYRRIARDGYRYARIAATSDTYFYELVAGLSPGTEYYYRVKAVNSLGTTGPFSNYGAITTP